MAQNNDNDTSGETADSLGSLAVQDFHATPQSIGPFGHATVHWHVTGPAGITITLNNAGVAYSGSEQVAPRVTTGYRLSARRGAATRNLGTVTVTVDTSTCGPVASGFSDPKAQLISLVKNAVLAADPSLFIPSHTVPGSPPQNVPAEPELWFTPGRMHLKLHLSAHVDGAPSPQIEITIEAGLEVQADGSLGLTSPSFNGTVDESWLLDLVPIYGLIVSLKTGAAEMKLPFQFKPLMDALPGMIGLLFPIDASRLRYQTVAIPGDPASPPFQIVACAKPRGLPPGALNSVEIGPRLGSTDIQAPPGRPR